jgi:hypothetical protein
MIMGQRDEVEFRLTEAEMAMLAAAANIRVRADGGDRKAKRQIATLTRKIAALGKRAKRGDARAQRAYMVWQSSGILQPSQTFTMDGPTPIDIL